MSDLFIRKKINKNKVRNHYIAIFFTHNLMGIFTDLCFSMNGFLLKHFFEFFEADGSIALLVHGGHAVVPLFLLGVLRCFRTGLNGHRLVGHYGPWDKVIYFRLADKNH